jgi:hypothetical protein
MHGSYWLLLALAYLTLAPPFLPLRVRWSRTTVMFHCNTCVLPGAAPEANILSSLNIERVWLLDGPPCAYAPSRLVLNVYT